MSERERLVSNEVARLQTMLGDLDRDWGYIRWSAALLPLGGVAYMVYGIFAFSIWILLVVSFLVTAAYLIGVRRKEYESEIELLNRSFLHGPKSA